MSVGSRRRSTTDRIEPHSKRKMNETLKSLAATAEAKPKAKATAKEGREAQEKLAEIEAKKPKEFYSLRVYAGIFDYWKADLDLTDYIICSYIFGWCISTHDGVEASRTKSGFTWVDYANMLQQLSFLDISERTLQRRIAKIVDDLKIFRRKVTYGKHRRGKRSHFALSPKLREIHTGKEAE